MTTLQPSAGRPAGGRPARPFFGRSVEIEAVLGAVGSGGAIVVSGPAGIGKSRLLDEAVARLASAGSAVVRLEATPATARLPLEAVRPLLAAARPTGPQLTAGPTSTVDELALLVEAAEAAQRSGAVIAVDDAHLLDERSAALLHRIVRERRAPVLVTTRTGEATPGAVTALWRDRLAERLDLEPLDEAAAASLARWCADRRLPLDEVDHLYERTAGNPLFLVELVRGAHPGGGDDELLTAVRRRLGALPPPQREAVQLVALAEPVSLAIMDAELDVLADLESTGTVSVTGDGPDAAVRLSHPLYGEVVRADLGDDERARLAGVLAARLVAASGRVSDAELRSCVLAVDAGLVPASDVAVAGARQAVALGDVALARQLAEAASGAAGDYDAVLLLGDLDRLCGDGDGADANYAAAEQLARTDDEVARVGVARAQLHAFLHYDAVRSVEIIDLARSRIRDPKALAELEAGTALIEGSYLNVVERTTRLLDEPDRSPEAAFGAALVAAWVAVQHLQVDEADRLVELARHEAELAEVGSSEVDMLDGVALGAATAAGRLEEAAASGWSLVTGPAAARRATGLTALVLAQVEWLRGRWADAAKALDLALHQLRHLDHYHVLHVAASHASMVATWRGDRQGADAALAEAHAAGGTSDPFGEIWVGRAEGWRLLLDGDRAGALERLARAGRAHPHPDSGNYAWSCLVLHDAVSLGGAVDVVGDLRRALSHMQGASLHEQLAAHAEGTAAGDGAAVASAAQRLDAMGAVAPALAAWADAAVLLDARSPEACRAATRWQVLAERLEPPSPSSGRPPDDLALSCRQVEVARMAAQGASGPTIAATIGISSRTVDNHLAAVYRRTGVSGRDELASLFS